MLDAEKSCEKNIILKFIETFRWNTSFPKFGAQIFLPEIKKKTKMDKLGKERGVAKKIRFAACIG